MRVTTLLNELSKKLTNPDGELMVTAEKGGNEVLLRVADALASCACILKMAADETDDLEPIITSDRLDEMAEVATAFDNSGDDLLRKQASVMDELLLTIGSKKNSIANFKSAQDTEVEKQRQKYRDQALEEAYTKAREQHNEEIGVEDAKQALDKKVKQYRPLETSLSTRYSPDMPGVQLMRIGDNVYQCPVTKKIFNYNAGYTTAKGNKVPGSAVENQTQQLGFRAPEHMNFSTREEVLNGRS